jgi:hypothetical protein
VLKNLWRKRDNTLYLIDNDDFFFFHNLVKSQCKKMKDDIVITGDGKIDKINESYLVTKDPYGGIVNLHGSITAKSLKNLIKSYRKWRIILWKIPTTPNGLHSMVLAVKKGFNIVGYDLVGFDPTMGNSKLHDSLILAYYPNGSSQALKVDCLDQNKPLYNRVRDIFYSRIN